MMMVAWAVMEVKKSASVSKREAKDLLTDWLCGHMKGVVREKEDTGVT